MKCNFQKPHFPLYGGRLIGWMSNDENEGMGLCVVEIEMENILEAGRENLG